jgi:cytochrome c-type protein NapB
MTMKKTLLGSLAIVCSLSCGSTTPPPDAAVTTAPPTPQPAAVSATPDSEIGLAPGTAFDQPPQAPIAFNTVEPGESELRPRPNAEFPPVIPHSTEGFSSITRSENPCLDCHEPEAARYAEATALPQSHQVDLRRTPSDQGDEVVGARWVCTSCHVTQTDTVLLVESTSRH